MPKKLYKFRSLQNCTELERIKDIIENGFYCNDFLGFNDMNEGTYKNSPDNIGVNLDEKLKYKICSFSDICAVDNELMWGHYANAGKGIVIEIEPENWNDFKQVQYINSKENLKSEIDILTRKSAVWQHESEWRYLKNNVVGNVVKLGKITKIYFGRPYKKLKNYDNIEKKHEKLRKYLSLKEELKKILRKKHIEWEDYEFIGTGLFNTASLIKLKTLSIPYDDIKYWTTVKENCENVPTIKDET